MKVDIIEFGNVKEENLQFAVIGASFQGKWVLVKHMERNTWEIPGGHREEDEDITAAAERELFEETGAKVFKMQPVCDYSVSSGSTISFGRLFYAVIEEFEDLPDSEIEEVKLFDELPNNLTYPDIQPYLYEQICSFKGREIK